jgi:hypothetical protein
VVRVGIALIVFLCGCARTTWTIRPDEALDPAYAYLYGRFFINATEVPGALARHQSIALQVSCTDESQHTIWFSASRDVQVLKVRPSACALAAVMWSNQNGVVVQTKTIAQSDMLVHDFLPGKAYYLGDYFARGIFTLTPHVSFNELFWSWAMDAADDRYESTTAEMQRAYHNLARLPTLDKRLVPPKPPSKRGAVVITDPKEPVMTPDRTARVAGFTRSAFASPAACEAACPTGQCLPFRGEAGAAMTCIVRCEADKDCPGGFACNCPNREKPEGPDCHPIATTPMDRLARICLPVAAPKAIVPATSAQR